MSQRITIPMKSLNLPINCLLAACTLFSLSFSELGLPFEKKDLSAAPLSSESLDNSERIYGEWLNELEVSETSNEWRLQIEKTTQLPCVRVFNTPENIDFCQENGDKNIHKIDLVFESQKQLDGIETESYPLFGWTEYNQDYYNKHGISLEEKMLFKASHVFGFPVNKLLIEIGDGCSSILLRITNQYQARIGM